MKLLSWNVNGLRAWLRKIDLAAFLERHQPDVLCLQEVRARPEQVDLGHLDTGYQLHWNPGCKAGYAGTLTFTKTPPSSISHGIGEPEGDAEGRVQVLRWPGLTVVNCYTPNAQNELRRLAFRTEVWDKAFRRCCKALAQQGPTLICGDLNVAHEPIDLARPEGNRRNAGFTDEERAGFSALLKAGFVDSFRHAHPDEGGHYTWWSQRGGARARNVGWRIDYSCVSEALLPAVREAFILPDEHGSDHCPVGIALEL